MFAAGLAVFASAAGILMPEIYAGRENSVTMHELPGRDILNLVVGMALLAVLCFAGLRRYGSRYPDSCSTWFMSMVIIASVW